VPLNKGKFTKTTLPIGWLLFTLLVVETYNLSTKLPTKMHQLHYPASRTSFSGTITSCRISGARRNFSWGGFIQRHRVVICIWCALFVTSQNDVIVLFTNQRFGEVC